MQTVCFILVSTNSESWSRIQLDPTWYDEVVKYVGVVRVKQGYSKCIHLYTIPCMLWSTIYDTKNKALFMWRSHVSHFQVQMVKS